MALSNRENFLKIFRGEKPDKILLISDLTYWRDSQIIQGKLPQKYMGNTGFLRLHLDLGIMPYYIYAIDDEESDDISVHQIGGLGKPFNGVFGLKYEGVEIETLKSGNRVDTFYNISGETLKQTKIYMPKSYCYSFQEYPIKTPGDLKTLQKIVEHYEFYSTVDDYMNLSEKWGENGVPIAPLPRSPLSALIVDWMGLEGFSFAHVDYPEEITKTLECIDRSNDSAFDIIFKSPAEVFHFCDNLSASNFASFFPLYAEEYYTRRFKQLHSQGKRAAVHIDGTLRGILGQVAATEADAAESLTPKPVGDLEIKDLRMEADNNRMILWGGLPGCLFTQQFKRNDIYNQVLSIIKHLDINNPFIAGSADQIPPDADLEYVKYATALLSNPEATINETL
jgi:hypothetical protein